MLDNNTPTNPLRNRAEDAGPPMTTILLCALCIAITLAHYTTSPSDGTVFSRLGHFVDSTPFTIWSGHYWPLVTTMFLHADFMHGMGISHIVFNMLWLYQLGTVLELTIGPLWYILFVIAAAAVGSCCELALTGHMGIGASGVVYALFGLMWMGRRRYPHWNMYATPYNMLVFIAWGLFCIILTATNIMPIGNGAHAGGLLFGLTIGGLAFGIGKQRLPWLAPLTMLVAICVLSLKFMPWSAEWTWWKAEQEFDRRRYTQAIRWYTRSIRDGAPRQDGMDNVSRAWHNIASDAWKRGDLAGADKALAKEKAIREEAGLPPEPAPSPASGGE